MGSAMMRLTVLTAIMMAGIAVLTSNQITAQTAHVIIRKIVYWGSLPLLLVTVSVMMRQIMLPATMMVETVVDIQQQQQQQQQQQLLLHLGVEVQTGPTINGVMMKTTILAAILMAELVVIITSVIGMSFAQ